VDIQDPETPTGPAPQISATPGPEAGMPAAPQGASEAAPPVLADLISAGLVSHEMIGDPARLGGETAALRALCELVAGPVYRIDPYHYAFRAGPADLGGRLEGLAPGAWTGALEAALADELGPEAVWLNATDLLPEAGAALAQPLLMLRAHDGALRDGLETAGPGLQAVVNARYAAECARLTAGAGAGEALDARLGEIEARQVEILERLAAQNAALETLAGLGETLAVVLRRLDGQSEVLHTHIAREDRVADQLGLLAGLAARPSDFETNVGVTLAEFLARIEQVQAEGLVAGHAVN
jgi:hypothetical protein